MPNPPDWPTETRGSPFQIPDPPPPPPPSERERRLEQALKHIVEWAATYPLSKFPTPDMEPYREALKAANLSLEPVTNAAMRHVLKDAAIIAEDALGPRTSSP